MSSTLVYDAFKSRLVAQMTETVVDFEQIETALQQGTDPWLSLEDTGGTDELMSIGTPAENWVEDTGFFDIHVFTPLTGGLGPTRALCGTVRDQLRYHRFTGLPAGNTLRVDAVNPPEPGVIHDGLWHSMIVTAEYTHRYPAATAA